MTATITRLSAKDADQRVGGKWFRGHTNHVVLVEDECRLDELVATDAQFAIYDRGLTVGGTVDLGSGVRSIVVVRGTLRARRVILGDAVLVVTGRAEVSEFVFAGATKGVLEVDGVKMVGRQRTQLVRDDDTAVLKMKPRKPKKRLAKR